MAQSYIRASKGTDIMATVIVKYCGKYVTNTAFISYCDYIDKFLKRLKDSLFAKTGGSDDSSSKFCHCSEYRLTY